MAKKKTVQICSSCQHTQPIWVGICPTCGEAGTFEEQKLARPASGSPSTGHGGPGLSIHSLKSRSTPAPRYGTGFPELDRVFGGGVVEGSVMLIGGDPGVGKSTLLLQSCAKMSQDRRVVYVSGEESLDQIQVRARRLGVSDSPVDLVSTDDAIAVAHLVSTLPSGSLVVVDSVQTMRADCDSMPGSASQVRATANALIPSAKSAGVSLVLVNHVTKHGDLAGPNVLMHAVDAVFFVETDTASGIYRIVRSEKNRFGATDEVGIFEMLDEGLSEVANPSEIFISQRDASAFGSVIFPSLEGKRPVLLEVQALVSPTSFGTGRRSANGWDTNRLNMILATLSARLGLSFSEMDVYVNVAGGMRVVDPAMDLAVVASLVSAHSQCALPADLAVFGEIGLAGEVRAARRPEARIREATSLGLGRVFCPSQLEKPHGRGRTLPAGCRPIHRIIDIFDALPNLAEAYSDHD